jgi:hypothetical protein
VFFEFGPFHIRRRRVFLRWPFRPAPGEEVLVVADQVLLKHGHVALGRLQVEVAKQLGTDVNR